MRILMAEMRKIGFRFMLMAAILIFTGMDAFAQDWPQWRGPQRDGVLKKTDLNLDWTAKKPPLTWTFKQAGSGYAAPVIVGTTLYCQGAGDGKDFAFALDTQTGNLKWKQDLGDEYKDPGNRGGGPRGSVTVDGDKLYLIRGGGQIHCLSATDGKMIWQKDFTSDFGGKLMSSPNWGVSESPLIDGNLVICTPGSDNGTMAALDKNTGAVVWRSKEWTDPCGFSSAIVAEVGGIRQYIQQAGKGVAGISAKDGKLLWKFDYPVTGRGPSAVIPTPVFNDNMVYVTNGYNCGCMGIRLTKEGENIKAEIVYANNRDISSQHGGVVLINGYLYGHSERPSDSWVCQNFKTGEIVWSQKTQDAGVSKGSVFGVGDHLLLMEENSGTITVIAASPAGWKAFGKIEIPERSNMPSQDRMVWTHLVVANDKLYLRDHNLLFCFDLKK